MYFRASEKYLNVLSSIHFSNTCSKGIYYFNFDMYLNSKYIMYYLNYIMYYIKLCIEKNICDNKYASAIESV